MHHCLTVHDLQLYFFKRKDLYYLTKIHHIQFKTVGCFHVLAETGCTPCSLLYEEFYKEYMEEVRKDFPGIWLQGVDWNFSAEIQVLLHYH